MGLLVPDSSALDLTTILVKHPLDRNFCQEHQ